MISSPRTLIWTDLACAVADVFCFFLKHINAAERNFIIFNSSSSTSTPTLFLSGFSVWQFPFQYRLNFIECSIYNHGNYPEIWCQRKYWYFTEIYENNRDFNLVCDSLCGTMVAPCCLQHLVIFWRSTHWLGWGRWFVRHKITMSWVNLE